MSNTKMFIPTKIKVGYQKRDDTYTKKLAYVIYFDNKGVLRKEKSWNGWRDNKIAAKEFSNEPLEGFVLNKGVGGVRGSWSSWNTRNEYIRVYDPRDFEFEISVANLLFILQETSSIKGKGLEGAFVYAWDGAELVLLPVDSEEYVACKDHTARQDKKVLAGDVKVGFSYVMKNGTNVLYLGKYPYNDENWYGFNPVGMRHIFLNMDEPKESYRDISPYIIDTGFTKLAEHGSALVIYPDELDKFKKSKYYGEITGYKLSSTPVPDFSRHAGGKYIIAEGDGHCVIAISNVWRDGYNISKTKVFKPEVKNNSVKIPSDFGQPKRISLAELNKLKLYKLKVITPEGTKIEVRI